MNKKKEVVIKKPTAVNTTQHVVSTIDTIKLSDQQHGFVGKMGNNKEEVANGSVPPEIAAPIKKVLLKDQLLIILIVL